MKFEEKQLANESAQESGKTKGEKDQMQGDAMEEFLKNNYGEGHQSASDRDPMESFLEREYGEKLTNDGAKESAPGELAGKEDVFQAKSSAEKVPDTASTRGNVGERGGRGNSPTRKSTEKVTPIADARTIRESKNTEPRGKRGGLREEPAGKIIDAETSFAQRRKEANEARRRRKASVENANSETIVSESAEAIGDREKSPESTKKSPLEVGLEAGKQRTDKIVENTQNKIKELTDRGSKWMNEHIPNMLNYAMGSPEMMKSGMEQIKKKAQEGYESIKEKARGYKERFSERIREAKNKFFDTAYKIGLRELDLTLANNEKIVREEVFRASKAELKAKHKVDKQGMKVDNAIFFKERKKRKLTEKEEKLNKVRVRVEKAHESLQRIRRMRTEIREKINNPRRARQERTAGNRMEAGPVSEAA